MGVREICVFGDSIAKGVVLHPITSRYEIIKLNIEKLFGRNKVNIKNYSMFGCTVVKALSLIKRHARELTGYNSVFLEVGGNDCDFAWNEIAANPEKEHVPKTPLGEFKSLYEQVIEEIRNNGGKPTILTLPPLEPNRFFNWVSKGINKDNILQWLGDVDMIYRWQEMYNIEVMLLATKMDVPIIDIRSAFLKRNNYGDLICSDGIHPNNDGYDLIFKTIGEQYQHQLTV
ncbi:MAG: SGNH/GDSL hydrolase family protein [Eubacteriales bacterium]|nr:SGNH/GDSL hydrolase family protein [Eubacteriales bacterium]MDD4769027.1 SGNH/GDSL hydrolase family protein [Eubacteriales bacterium]